MSDRPAFAPAARVTACTPLPVAPARDVVVYWCTMARRTRWSFGLQHAVAHARALGRPLVVLEALRAGYPHASARLHRFALDAMAEDAVAYARAGVTHLAYLEPAPGAGRGLLAALAERACVVVTDDYPHFFLPRMRAAAARQLAALGTRLEAVDGCGLLPLAAGERAWPSAAHFRRQVQRVLPLHLGDMPVTEPLAHAAALPRPEAAVRAWLDGVRARWPMAAPALLDGAGADAARALAALPIDHGVPVVAGRRGGARAASALMTRFLDHQLDAYRARRNAPSDTSASGLSSYLHWGMLGVHELFAAVAAREGWTPARLAPRPTGRREGWWGMSPDAEAFLDELVTWRELAHGTTHFVPGCERFETLPEWARATLAAHAADRRAHVYDRDALEAGDTHDPLWNAAQGELRAEGRIHNYLRMLWGKKIVEWTRSAEEALDVMLHLNDRWALDGRDPNSVAGVTWVLGRYDRPWFPERAVFGTVRWMSSANTARKVRTTEYVARYGGARGGALPPAAGQISLL